jgi:protein TonB
MGKYRIWFILLSAILWSAALWGISKIKPTILTDIFKDTKAIKTEVEPPPPPPPPPPPKPDVPPPAKIQEVKTKMVNIDVPPDPVQRDLVVQTTPPPTPVTNTQVYVPPSPPVVAPVSPPPPSCSERDTGPVQVRGFNVERAYPQRALDQELEGTVRATLQVDANGNVTGVSVNSSSSSVFDSAVQREATRMKYKPARRNCENVSGSASLTVQFKLD